MTSNNLFYSTENEHIETIFKVVPPLDELKEGFGFMGVVLRNKITDELQCHICGKWFAHLQSHIFNHHKIRALEYKTKFGLPRCFGLVSRAISEKISNNINKIKPWERIKDFKKISQKAQIARRRNGAFNWQRNNAAFHNQKGICDEQILRRYLVLADQIGKNEPSSHDLNSIDVALLSVIRRRFGTLDKFKKHHGFTIKERPSLWEEDKLISYLRRWAYDHNKLPTFRDLVDSRPSGRTYQKKFGSWRKALSVAGLL